MSSETRAADGWLWLVLVFALVRGGLYASLLPPWGLIDEEQHVHYVQYLVEQRAIPVVGQVYLSPEIVQSIIATRRWEIVLGQPVVLPADPRQWGLEGYSYQGYHPPLYYLLLTPVYALLPDDILVKVAGLRWATVLLSVGTVWLLYRATREAFPAEPWLPLAAALLLVCLPERTAAVSRVNNDALLEAAGAAWLWAVARVTRRGLTTRASQALGALLGLGILAKLSFAAAGASLPLLWWQARRDRGVLGRIGWTLGLAALLAGPWLLRNQMLYGDPTGYAAFERLYTLPAPALTAAGVTHALITLWRNAWLVWWQGPQFGSPPALDAAYLAWAGLCGLALWGLVRRRRASETEQTMLATSALFSGAVIALALYSFFAAQVPGLQGRFLLAGLGAIVILICAGWWGWPAGGWLWAGAVGLWLAADALELFLNLLPTHYFFSAYLAGGSPPDFLRQWPEAWAVFSSRLFSDKPAGVRWVWAALFLAYGPLLARTARLVWKVARAAGRLRLPVSESEPG